MENYEKLKVVGRGAHGMVYLCKRLFDNKNVIIKEIAVEWKTPEERQAALGEVKLLDLLNHANIIGYYENFFDQNNLCIVMEYAEGGTLADFIADRKNCLMKEHEILFYFAQIVNSLFHLHSKNILHRDMKTQNILLDKTRTICKLSDFGISKILSTRTKAASTVIGTPSYLSPEICEGKHYNKKSDVWSLGCILYELTALRKAFEAETLGSLVVQITRGNIKPVDDQYSDELKQLILSIFTLDPERRPTLNDIRSTPIMSNYIYSYCDIGAVCCPKLFKPSKTVKLRSSNRSKKHFNINNEVNQSHMVAVQPMIVKPKTECKIFAWGKGLDGAASLPLPSTKIITNVACSLSTKMAVTKDGELLTWHETENEDTSLDSTNSPTISWCCKIVNFSSPVKISTVACGEMFYALITDRGILMTCGNGINGCLGHAAITDIHQPKIVQDLVGYEVTRVACGPTHVIASTIENELYAWGKPDDGRLGIQTKEVQFRPKKIDLPSHVPFHSLHCSIDASAFVCQDGSLWVTGRNGYNKLGLWMNDNRNPKVVWEFTKSLIDIRIDTDLKYSFSLGLNHSGFVSRRKLYTFGSNHDDQLGPRVQGSLDWRPNQVLMPDDMSICKIACGDGYTIVCGQDQQLFSWGKQRMGKLGRNGIGKDIGSVNLDIPGESHEVVSMCSLDGCTLVCVSFEH